MTISVLDAAGNTAAVLSASELTALLNAIATAAAAPVSQAVSANALPLPAGAATAAKQDTLLAANAAYTGRTALTVGTPGTPGRAIEIAATVAGNVALTLSDNSVTTIPVSVGLTILPYAVKTVLASGTTATATYGNLL